MKAVGDALNRRELLAATVALGAGASAWLPLAGGAASAPINERMTGNFSPVHVPGTRGAIDANHLTDRDGSTGKLSPEGRKYSLPTRPVPEGGPGHVAVLRDDARNYLVYHAYDAQQDGRSVLRIAPIEGTPDGWPRVAA